MFGVKQKIKWLSSNTTMDIEKQFDEFFESTTVAGILEVTPLVKKDGRISKFMLVVRYIPKS